jgi:hypothetical protein
VPLTDIRSGSLRLHTEITPCDTVLLQDPASRSSASGLIDNSPGGIFPALMFRASGRTAIKRHPHWHTLGIARSGRHLDTGVRKDERQSKGLKQPRAGGFDKQGQPRNCILL